jgi:retron-type reverse transcriptase
MRKRSFHSSVPCYTKESSIDTPTFETLYSASLKPVRAVKPLKVAKRVGVTTIVMGKLEQYRKPEQKYYNLIKLIADPYFLVACYEELAKKKSFISPPLLFTLQNPTFAPSTIEDSTGTRAMYANAAPLLITGCANAKRRVFSSGQIGQICKQVSEWYTIDGLNWEWFVKIAESLKSGIFVFKPNPNPNPNPNQNPNTKHNPNPTANPNPKANPNPNINSNSYSYSNSKSNSNSNSNTNSNSNSNPKTKPKQKPKHIIKPKSKSKANPTANPNPKPNPKHNPNPNSNTNTNHKPLSKHNPKHNPKPTGNPNPKGKPKPKPKPNINTKTNTNTKTIPNPNPNRILEIPKTNGNPRPLDISEPMEKIVQKALHAVLEAIFESKFLSSSPYFIPQKSVHSSFLRFYPTIPKNIKQNWVIQVDITKCSDQIPHGIIIKRINKYVGDPRFIELLKKYLQSGYLINKTGKIVKSDLGTPHGGNLSPLLVNIVLHELDRYMFKYESSINKGVKQSRKPPEGETKHIINPEYTNLDSKSSRANYNLKMLTLQLNPQRRKLRRSLIVYPYCWLQKSRSRMEYIRYADYFVVFVSGSLKEAKFIQSNIKDVLKTKCGLELNQDNFVITNLSKEKLNLRGAQVKKVRCNPQLRVRKLSGVALGVSKLRVKAPNNKLRIELIFELKKIGFIRQNKLGQYIPQAFTSIVNQSHYEIISFYNSKIQDIFNCYAFSSNNFKLGSVFWLFKASCALTLARKFKLRTMRKVFIKFGTNLKCSETNKELTRPPSLKVKH